MQRAKDHGRSRGAVLERAEGKEHGSGAEYCAGSPGPVKCCPGGKGSKYEGKSHPPGGAPWQRTEPHELSAGAVLLDDHAQPA